MLELFPVAVFQQQNIIRVNPFTVSKIVGLR